jgi:hypothetical protein
MGLLKTANEAADFIMETIRRFGVEKFGRYYARYPAKVVNNLDPEGLGRVQVILPMFGTKPYPTWVCPGSLGGVNEHGFYFLPEIDDVIYVEFEEGDAARPIYVGGRPKASGPHASMTRTATQVHRGIRTPSGIMLRFSDGVTNELLIEHPSGAFLTIEQDGTFLLGASDGSHLQLKASEQGISLVDANGSTILLKDGKIHLIGKSASGAANSVSVDDGVTIMSHGPVNIQSSGKVSIISGNIHLGDPNTGIMRALVNESFLSFFATHTHTSAAAGSPTTPPLVPISAPAVTSKTKST